MCTAKHIPSLAEMLLDQVKSKVALLGLPNQLMRTAGHIVALNKRHLHHPSIKQAWNTSLPKHVRPHLPSLLKQTLYALQHPTSIQLRPTSTLELILQTDASDQGWGACLLKKRQGNRQLCTTLDSPTTSPTHHSQRRTGLSISRPQSPGSHSPRQHAHNPSRCNKHRVNMEQSIQDHRSETAHHPWN